MSKTKSIMKKTKIQWTHYPNRIGRTWNIFGGCDKVSEGCKNCYAILQVRRLSGNPNKKIGPKYSGLVTKTNNGTLNWTGETKFFDDRINEPYHWTKPSLVFVNSLSDTFHPGIDRDTILRVFQVMRDNPEHIFQVLTKRPERIIENLPDDFSPETFPNVWIGTSIEHTKNVKMIDRVRELKKVDAAVRFLSVEPILDFVVPGKDLLNGIDWIIVGGESGPLARPIDVNWFRVLRRICILTKTPFFFKQTGSVYAKQKGLKDRKGGNLEELPPWMRLRIWPNQDFAECFVCGGIGKLTLQAIDLEKRIDENSLSNTLVGCEACRQVGVIVKELKVMI